MYFIYEVEFLGYEGGHETSIGIATGDNFAEAAKALEGWYGEDLEEIRKLAPLTGPEDGVIDFSSNVEDAYIDFLIKKLQEKKEN